MPDKIIVAKIDIRTRQDKRQKTIIISRNEVETPNGRLVFFQAGTSRKTWVGRTAWDSFMQALQAMYPRLF